MPVPTTPLPATGVTFVASTAAVVGPGSGPYANTKTIILLNRDATNDVYIRFVDTRIVPATASVTVIAQPVAGNTITINGVVLTGVAGARTSGNNDFSVAGTTRDAIAAEILAALLDVNNSFIEPPNVGAPLGGAKDDSSTVAPNGLVTFLAGPSFPGTAGNALTLATNNPAAFTISGATFAGGANQLPAVGTFTTANSIVLPPGVPVTLDIGTEGDGRNPVAAQGFWSTNTGSGLTLLGVAAAGGPMNVNVTYVQG